MNSVLLAGAACLLGLLVTWGYGRLAVAVLYPARRAPAGFACVLGLAVLSFLGGVLNALHLAYAPGLVSLVLAGVVAAGYLLTRAARAGALAPPRGVDFLVLLPLLAYLVLLASTTLPAGVINTVDDLHNYLIRPMRMLATGSMGGNPFSALGVDALGAQSFLQGFVLMALPPGYAHAFDGLFCLLLSGLVLDDFARDCGARPLLRAAAIGLLVLLPLQVVNLAAAYSASALLIALLYASRLLLATVQGDVPAAQSRAAVAVGTLAATLVGLRLNFVLFCPVYAVGLLAGIPRTRRWRVAWSALLGVSLALAPWLLVVVTTHAASVVALLSGSASTGGIALHLGTGGLPTLLTPWRALYWGGMAADYEIAFLLTALPCALLLRRSVRECAPCVPLLVPVAAAAPALLVSLMICTWLVEVQNAIRYSCPALVSLLPCALVAYGLALRTRASRGAGGGWRRTLTRGAWLALLAAWAFGPVAFAGLLVRRVEQAVDYGAAATYRVDPRARNTTNRALSPAGVRMVRALQARVPPHVPLLTWTGFDAGLDFARNPVYALNQTGMVLPVLPARGDPAALAVVLRGMGVHYVLLQLAGIGAKRDRWYREARAAVQSPTLRRIWGAVLRTRAGLRALAARGRMLAYDAPFVLFEVAPPAP